MVKNQLSLYDLNIKLKDVIRETMLPSYWVVGEISDIKTNYSGHCYLELIQKDDAGNKIVARSRATIWVQTYNLIKPYFETTTGQNLVEGLKVLIKVRIEFHEQYGLSLNVLDIEPTYTVGELAIEKKKILERLHSEGVVEMNKELILPRLCQRIAVVSSATAAGYEDFLEQLETNAYGYKFYIKLFPAIMQGEASEKSVINALDKVYTNESFFDAAVIIRGGGSQADLNCFNSYWLAYNITQYPIPVLTGIGHEQDDTIVDLVAHTRLKTPTAVASYLIDLMGEEENELDDLSRQIVELAQNGILEKKQDFSQTTSALKFQLKDLITSHRNKLLYFSNYLASKLQQDVSGKIRHLNKQEAILEARVHGEIERNRNVLDTSSKVLKSSLSHAFKHLDKKISSSEEKLRMLDPLLVLKRGFSITMSGDKLVKNSKEVNAKDEILSVLYNGEIRSTVNQINNGRKKED